ncbi:hypothetical protein HKX48_000991 [Thoreauomyces humboldtii]|nr:hypothetical protein HKX48_000991 [Thoreauomyces humboldtii]
MEAEQQEVFRDSAPGAAAAALPVDPHSAEPVTDRRALKRVIIVSFLVNISMAIAGQSYDQAIITRFCDNHYETQSFTSLSSPPNAAFPTLRDCTLPEILTPASSFTSLLVTLLVIPSVLTSLLAGPLSDAYGRKVVTACWLAALILDAACPLLVVNGQGLWVLAAGKLVLGLCGGLATPVMLIFSAVADCTAKVDRSRAFGYLSGAGMLANFGGMIIGGLLVKYTKGFLVTFGLSTAMCFVSLLYYIAFVPETRQFAAPPPPGTPVTKDPLHRRLAAVGGDMFRAVRNLPGSIVAIGLLSAGMRMSTSFLIPFYAAQVFGWQTWDNTLYGAEGAAFSCVTFLFFLGFADKTMRRYVMKGDERRAAALAAASDGEDTPLLVPAADATAVQTTEEESPESHLLNARVSLYLLRIFIGVELLHIMLFTLSNRSWMLYAIVPIDSLGALTAICARTILLEFAPKDMYGTINSFYGVGLNLFSVGAIKALAAVYAVTADTKYPNAAFAIFGATAVPALVGSLMVRFGGRGTGR